MKTQSIHGYALIIGMLLSVGIMFFHPIDIGNLAEANVVRHNNHINILTHTLGLLSLPFVLFGFVGVLRRTGWDHPLSLFAFIIYSLSVVAIMLAAIASGLIKSALVQQLIVAPVEMQKIIEGGLYYTSHINQACAKVFVVGASLAIFSWSCAIVRLSCFERWIGIFGWLVAAIMFTGIVSSHIRLDTHGFGAIMLLQATWAIALGMSLIHQ